MAEASSRLDINREALSKIKSVMLISTFEVSENWEEKRRAGKCGRYCKNIIELRKGLPL